MSKIFFLSLSPFQKFKCYIFEIKWQVPCFSSSLKFLKAYIPANKIYLRILSNYHLNTYVIKVNNSIYYIIKHFHICNNKEVLAVRYSVEETPDVRMGQREDGVAVNNLNRAFVVNKWNYRQQLLQYIQINYLQNLFQMFWIKIIRDF